MLTGNLQFMDFESDVGRSSRTAYMVTSGCYSDYSVHCVFERREDAERYIAAGLGEEIEETELYAAGAGVFMAYIARIRKQDGFGWQAGAIQVTDYRTTVRPEHKTEVSDWGFRAWGPDRELVVKSVRDRYTAWKATQEGVS